MKGTMIKQIGDGQTGAVVKETGLYIVDQIDTGLYKLNEVFHNRGNTSNYDQIGGVYPAAELCERIKQYCSAADAFILIEYDDLKKVISAGSGGDCDNEE